MSPQKDFQACQNAVIKLAFKIPFEIGDTVVSRAMGMVLYGKVTGYAVHDDQPVLDLERFWVSRPTSESEEKERRESGIHNWYRTVNECQAWAPRSGFVRPHPGGRLHWREGNVLLCRRNADATAFTEGTNPHSRQHLDDCCSSCRAELKRRASAQIKHHKEWPATSNDLTLTPGQRVTVLHQGPGTVQGPSKLSGRIAVALDTEMGPPFVVNRFPDQLTPLEDARVTTETTTKKARKSKAGADVAPVDFKKLAEETRTKMAAKPAPAKAKRKPVRQLHFQPGDFVSYRRGSSYLTALVREVREGGHALELPQDHPVNGQWQVEATVEEVTPRVLPLSLVAPLAVGDRVARALFGPDLVPLSIEGDCVVQVVTAGGEVLIRNEQGQQWQGVPDQRLTLCGRADLNTALRDLGRPVSGELDAPQEQAAPTLPDKASGKARSARNKVDMEPYPFASGDFVRLVDSRISALVQEQLLDGEYALLIPTEEEGTQRIIATAPAFEVFPHYVGVFEPGDRVRHLKSARYGTVTAVAGERVTVSYRSGHVEELIGAAALDTAGIPDLKRAAKPLGVVLPSEATTAGLDKVQAPAKASPVIEADTAYSAGQLVAVLGRRRQHGVISRILNKGRYAVLLEASGIDSLAYSESSLEPLILAPRFPLQVGDGVVLDQSGADWFPELAASAYLQVTFANGVQARVIRIEDDPESAKQHDVEPHYLKVVRRANLDHAAYDLGWKRSPAGSEANLMAESDTPASDTALRFQVGDVVRYETAENGEKVERVALVRRELLDGQYGDYLVTVVDEHSLEVQRRDDEDWDVMVNESRMNIIYPSGEMDWKPEILALVPELGWTRAALKATNPALLLSTPAPPSPSPRDDVGTPSELPGTPTLLSPQDITPGTLGVVEAPLHQLVRSGCNVRTHYVEQKTVELAAGMKADGQLQECVGRWNAKGELEIVAGETRRRAQLLREEQGETGLTLRVNVRELTDVQALRISAQENLQRNNMTPLEECETMLRLRNAGENAEDIRITFGYASTKPVVDRLAVAENLHTGARDHLDAGNITLAQAIVIARAPGEEMQKTMLQSARNRYTASDLSNMLTRGQFLLSTAKFDVEKSGLEVRKDLFDVYRPYFESKARAMEAQLAWAEKKAEKLRAKGKHTFVDVVCGESYKVRYQGRYETCADADPERGLVLFINEATGEYKEINDLKYKASKKVEQPDGSTKTESVREMPASAHEAAHLHRARSLRQSLLGQAQVTLVLTVHSLIASFPSRGKAPIGSLEVWNGGVTTLEIEAKLTSWQTSIAAGTGATPGLGNLPGDSRHRFDANDNLRLYDYLTTLDTPELLDLLNVLVACQIYEPNIADYREGPAPTFRRLAEQSGANAVLAQQFKLTDEWLKRYPRHELVALAEEAGLGRALVEDCKTLKDMRGRILEHAEQLHKEGFVPRLVRFEEVKA